MNTVIVRDSNFNWALFNGLLARGSFAEAANMAKSAGDDATNLARLAFYRAFGADDTTEFERIAADTSLVSLIGHRLVAAAKRFVGANWNTRLRAIS